LQLFINFARFHPLLVHLPIGVLLFAAFLELWKRFRKTNEFDAAIRMALGFGFLAGVAAGTTGYFLSEEGGYDAQMLWQHKWSGISLTVLTGLLFFTNRSNSSFLQKIYAPLFVGVLGLLTFAGHLGSNLTHGSDYLFSKPEDHSIVVTDIEKAPIFSTFIEPILKTKCNSCHNPSKAKGDLIMTSQAGLLEGGATGSIFNFKKPEASEMLTRIHLPLEEKNHMPPKGKKQISEDEAKLLKWWIENKACFDCTVDSSKNRLAVAPILEKYKSSQTNLKALKIDSISDKTLENLNQTGISVSRLSAKNPLLIVNLGGKKNLNYSILKRLKKVGKNIIELNLAGSNFSDNEIGIFKSMPHLKKLKLQNTSISDATIRPLKKLKYLESLNIYGTSVTDKAIADLKEISTLKNLYCWQTKISESAITDLQNAKPTLQISSGIDKSIFGNAKLNAPKIIAEKQIFKDSMSVRFENEFKNARVFYTLDGSEPDSSSLIYSDSFFINDSKKIKVLAELKGWKSSSVNEQQFVHSKVAFKSVKLSSPPADAYKANGSKSLFDLNKENESFAGGNWLGWQGKNITATLELKEKQLIEKVYIRSVSDPNSWIFFPKGIQVYTSIDGKNFNLKKETTYSPTESGALNEMKFFELNFESTETRILKIKVLSTLKNPSWHPAPGEPCWLFIDEILAE